MPELNMQGILKTFPYYFWSPDLKRIISLLIDGSIADCPACVSQLLDYGYLLSYCPVCQTVRTKYWVNEIHNLAQRYLEGKSISILRCSI